MDDFKKELEKLNVDDFQAGELNRSEEKGPHDTVHAQFFGGACGGGACGGGFCGGGFCGGGFRCFRCFRCFQCFRCFRCFRCGGCF